MRGVFLFLLIITIMSCSKTRPEIAEENRADCIKSIKQLQRDNPTILGFEFDGDGRLLKDSEWELACGYDEEVLSLFHPANIIYHVCEIKDPGICSNIAFILNAPPKCYNNESQVNGDYSMLCSVQEGKF